jgi:antitoxin Phd
MLTMTSVEAQNRFGQLLDAAQREPIAITRHGRVVAFVISPQDMKELTDSSIVGSKVVADLEAWQIKAALGGSSLIR